MALTTVSLSSLIQTALAEVQVKAALGIDSTQVQKEFADAIALAVYTWILTATVTIPPGIVVQTVPATGTGATAGPGIGTIS